MIVTPTNKNQILFCLAAILSLVYVGVYNKEIADILRATNDKQDYTKINSQPKALQTDIILQPNRWANPIVIRQYKFVFFAIPKVASTEWKLLFRRLEGQAEWNTTGLVIEHVHDPMINNLTTIDKIPLDEAQHILTSSEWTRAVILREPKERVLSAFLNKFVSDQTFFRERCCNLRHHNVSKKECRSRQENTDFSYFLNRTVDCPDEHWNPQYSMIDAKWWDTINFVGYMDNVSEDAKELLQSITSIDDGTSAWEKYGKTGWGRNGTDAFMRRDTAHHATNAHSKLRSYYTRKDEKLVEKFWSGEWNHSAYHFPRIHLFSNSTTSTSDEG